MADAPDLTDKYNTKLTPDQEAQYQSWAKLNPNLTNTYDYDSRGAWLADAAAASNGHLPDTWKKPNHPTFSKESEYSGKDGNVGGEWVDAGGGKWKFKASPQNIKNMGEDGLRKYFQQREPDSDLVLPVGPTPDKTLAAKLYAQ